MSFPVSNSALVITTVWYLNFIFEVSGMAIKSANFLLYTSFDMTTTGRTFDF